MSLNCSFFIGHDLEKNGWCFIPITETLISINSKMSFKQDLEGNIYMMLYHKR